MKDKLTTQLITAILEWWEEHKYDVDIVESGESWVDERNTYTNPPEFVKLAKKLKRKLNDN